MIKVDMGPWWIILIGDCDAWGILLSTSLFPEHEDLYLCSSATMASFPLRWSMSLLIGMWAELGFAS